MAKNKVEELANEMPVETFGAPIEETPVTADEAPVFGTEETSAPDTEETSAPDTEETSTPEAEVAMGDAQGTNMQITTTIATGTMPQVDSSEFAYKVRHIMNGDIQDEDGKSLVAEKMVTEAGAFQLSKPVVKSFPETGAAYLETLDFKVNQ